MYSLEEQLMLVRKDGRSIRFIKDSSKEIQLEAIRESDYNLCIFRYCIDFEIKDFKDDFSERNIKMIKKDKIIALGIDDPILQMTKQVEDKSLIQSIKNLSKEMQLEAIKQNGHFIQWVDNPSKEMQLEAIKNSGYNIRFIENPSEEMQLEAIRESKFVLRYIKNPSKKVQLKAIKYNAVFIKLIDNPSLEIQLEAVKNSNYYPKIFQYCPDFKIEDFRDEILVKGLLG